MSKYDKWATPTMIIAMAIWCVCLVLKNERNEDRIEGVVSLQVEIVETLTLTSKAIVRMQNEIDTCNYRLDTSVETDKKVISAMVGIVGAQERVMDHLGFR